MTEVRQEEAESRLAMATGVFTGAVVLSVFGLYVFGNSRPEGHEVAGEVELAVPPEAVYALLSDYERRPDWRPRVARIGRIADDGEGRQVWRELDEGDDRFDFKVLEEVSGQRVVLTTASPDQIGYDATWSFSVAPRGSGSVLTVEEQGEVDNPLWRGIFYLRTGPWSTVEQELTMVADALSPGATPRRLR